MAAVPALGRFKRARLDMCSLVSRRSRKQRSGCSAHQRDTKRNISSSIDILKVAAKQRGHFTALSSVAAKPALGRFLCTMSS